MPARPVTVLALLGLAALCAPEARAQAQAQPALQPPAQTRAGFAQRADALVKPYLDAKLFSGAVLVAHRGRPVFRRAYGLANREWGVPNTPETRFRVGSITKQFTAAAILKLAEAGRLNLDDPIRRFYPQAPAAWERVTLRTLLTHSSGIPSYTNLPDYYARIQRLEMTPREIVALTADKPLLFEPGKGFDYDNTGYILLGLVVEAASGQPYDRYLREAIFDPLGLKDTGYDDATAILPRRASGYRLGNGQLRNAMPIASSIPYAAGAHYSTVDDLLAWDRALFSGRVLSDLSRRAMFADAGYGYGFGWYIGQSHGHRLWSHGGGINGFLTIKDTYPDDELTVLVLANTETAPVQAMAREIAALWFRIPDPGTEIVLEPEIMDRYAGRYRLAPGRLLTLAREGDHLVAQITGEAALPFLPEGDRTFVSKARNARITLDTEPDGRPTGLMLYRDGTDRAAPRIEVTQ
ncbi:serine hydrolase [Methylobacterium planeticum]|uniref:Serine hydrolase n=1 Tax=Methylobacterium planeticum TaxID=2615211 RepID=A0A6N6N0N6_9HYPH|nr:serine hydrolase [Methylobacterium planeticum]KAB1076002.1 serine hydrolase [Methylobacterium planeticum]